MLALALPISAAKPIGSGGDPLTIETDRRSISCNVEQQTIRWYGSFDPIAPCPGPNVVNNSTGCGWDIDDSWSMRGSGRASDIHTASLCVVSDGTHRAPVDVSVRAKNDQLLVRLDASDGRSWSASPIRDGNEYQYVACGDNFISAPHPEILGTNGGHGTIVTYTLTIDASARASNVTALLKYGNGIWVVEECE